jgi:hypothetical protein
MNFFEQGGNFLERRQVVVEVGVQQPQDQVIVQRVKPLGDLTALFRGRGSP